ncbi:MAG: hypothetical protein K2L02_02260 [Clostridia bacterium]|nr:hypothetical protein [Clostridia bacterium]
MLIDKNYIKNFKSLIVLFDGCDAFKIPIEDIAEINCKATDEPYGESEYFRIWDGTIKVFPKGGMVLDNSTAEEHCTLKERIEQYCDISNIYLERHDRTKIKFSLPYDPLVESINQIEIELSNCPSAEINQDGFITIGIGESSKMPKRTDNNFDELIEGWKDLFNDYRPDVLRARLRILTNYFKGEVPCLFAEIEILNKRAKHYDYLTFIFTGIQKVDYMIYPDRASESVELNAARLIDGNIFVDFVGYGLTFQCKEITVTNEIYIL